MNIYQESAKQNSASSDRVIFIAKCVVFLMGILITGLDVFVWRANMPL